MNLTLERSLGDDSDWWSLRGGGNWASVEGTADEWREVARLLFAGKLATFYGSSSRCAVRVDETGAVLWSPRNKSGDRDDVVVPSRDMARLAAEILSALPERGCGALVKPAAAGLAQAPSPLRPVLPEGAVPVWPSHDIPLFPFAQLDGKRCVASAYANYLRVSLVDEEGARGDAIELPWWVVRAALYAKPERS